jgi:hypothetical protein
MAVVATRFLRQRCVYWAPGPPSAQGQQTFLPPVELPCRWTDNAEEIVVKQGSAWVGVTSSAWVMLDRVVEEQGVLLKGTMTAVTDKTDPFANRGAFQIQRYVEISDVRGKNPVRKAYL